MVCLIAITSQNDLCQMDNILQMPFLVVFFLNGNTWNLIEISLQLTSMALINATSTLADTHYLNQCLPKPMPPYGVTKPQWVKIRDTYLNRQDIGMYIL